MGRLYTPFSVIMKRVILISAILSLITFLGGCTSKSLYKDVSDISEKNLGILKSNIDMKDAESVFPQASVTEYDKVISLFLDLEANRCDAAVMSEDAADIVIKRNQDYVVLGSVVTSDNKVLYVVVPRKDVFLEENMADEIGFFEKIKGSLSRNLFNEKAMHLIWGGFKTTVIIFFFGAIVAVILGAFLTYLSITHKCLWLYKPLSWFVMTIHDIPSVVLMMFFFYVIFGGAMNGILVSIIALGIYTSGALYKIFKIHITQVGKEQLEAGQMLGVSTFKCYRYIILPQAVKTMLPLVGGELKLLLRATSYAGYIAQKDLVKAVDAIRSFTYDAFVPLLLVSLLYLLLSWLIVKTLDCISKKYFYND